MIDEVAPATKDDFAAFYGRPLQMVAVRRNGKPIAIGGSRLAPDGRLFAHLDIDEKIPRLNIALVIRRVVAQFPRPVYAACWAKHYPTAPRLLTLLGFELTEEVTHDDKQIWVLK